MYDATLGDSGLIDDLYAQAVEKQSSKIKDREDDAPYYPSRRGYTREVEATLDVADNLIALRAETGKWRPSSTRFNPRPLFPGEAVQDKLRARNRKIRDEKIAAAQGRWRLDNASNPR